MQEIHRSGKIAFSSSFILWLKRWFQLLGQPTEFLKEAWHDNKLYENLRLDKPWRTSIFCVNYRWFFHDLNSQVWKCGSLLEINLVFPSASLTWCTRDGQWETSIKDDLSAVTNAQPSSSPFHARCHKKHDDAKTLIVYWYRIISDENSDNRSAQRSLPVKSEI